MCSFLKMAKWGEQGKRKKSYVKDFCSLSYFLSLLWASSRATVDG